MLNRLCALDRNWVCQGHWADQPYPQGILTQDWHSGASFDQLLECRLERSQAGGIIILCIDTPRTSQSWYMLCRARKWALCVNVERNSGACDKNSRRRCACRWWVCGGVSAHVQSSWWWEATVSSSSFFFFRWEWSQTSFWINLLPLCDMRLYPCHRHFRPSRTGRWHGIFNVRNDLRARCATRKRDRRWRVSTSVDSEELKKTGLHPASTGSRTHGSCFHWITTAAR